MRKRTAAFTMFGFSIGCIILNVITFQIKNADDLVICSAVCISFVLLPLFFYIIETPMYLLRKGQYEKLDKVITKIAKRNKNIDKSEEYLTLREELFKEKLENKRTSNISNKSKTIKKEGVKESDSLLKWLKNDKRNIFYQISLAFLIINNYSVYYGLTSSIQDLGINNIQLNGIILAVTLMTGYLFTMQRGPTLLRVKWAKITLYVKIFATGLLTFLSLWKYKENKYNLLVESIVSTLGLGMITAIQSYVIYSLNAELVPTEVRGKSIALTLLIGNLSGTFTPYLGNLSKSYGIHVMVGCSVSSFFALPFVYGLRETLKDKKLN